MPLVGLDALRPLILGPLREKIIRFEGSDWCCRQASLYVTYILRRLGYHAAMLEGVVTVEGNPVAIPIQHAWTHLLDEDAVVDLTITQANWIGRPTTPVQEIGPVWGRDPAYIHRSTNRVWNLDAYERLLRSDHWQKPGLKYQSICEDMLAFVVGNLRAEGLYASLP